MASSPRKRGSMLICLRYGENARSKWIPAFAGMTADRAFAGMTADRAFAGMTADRHGAGRELRRCESGRVQPH